MRNAYRILAIIIAVEVVIQAMAMVFAVAGLGIWVDEGGVLDKAAFESEDLSFTGVGGFIDPRHQRDDDHPAARPRPAGRLVLRQGARRGEGGGDRARRRSWCRCSSASSATSRRTSACCTASTPSSCSARPSTPPGSHGRLTRRRRARPSLRDPEPIPTAVPQLVTAARSRWRQIVAVAATLAIVVPLAWMWQASRMPGVVLGHGHGVRRHRRRPRCRRRSRHGDHGGHDGQRRRPRRGHRPARRRGGRADRPPGARDAGVGPGGRRLHLQRPDSPVRRSRRPRATCSRSACTTTTSRTASACTGTASTCPNAEDGVAGVTQDAIGEGEDHVYRFVVDDPGSYWYHSHQVSHTQVIRGLFGPLVVKHQPTAGDTATSTSSPSRTPTAARAPSTARRASSPIDVPDGQVARVRVVNTDNGAVQVWTSARRTGCSPSTPRRQRADAGGGRAGLRAGRRAVRPRGHAPARIQIGGSTVLVARRRPRTPSPQPREKLDMLSYGAAHGAAVRPGRGRPHLPLLHGPPPGLRRRQARLLVVHQRAPVARRTDVPRRRGRRRASSRSRTTAARCTRCTSTATTRSCSRATASRPRGSPWWVDSLDVENGETMTIAFVADNPGIWMDHCHNLKHAAAGAGRPPDVQRRHRALPTRRRHRQRARVADSSSVLRVLGAGEL